MFSVKKIDCISYTDQMPGTSGLRKKVKVFQQENYLQSYIQSVFNSIDIKNKSIIIGGDGRYYNKEAIQIIISMAIANGVSNIMVAQNGLLSTPSASHIIRKYNLDYGIILSASHNPAGINGDFGVKINGSNGAPIGVSITNKIYNATKDIKYYSILENFSLDLSEIITYEVLSTKISIIDTIKDYSDLMEEIFDFSSIENMIKSNRNNFIFNAFYGITSPYAVEIFKNRLGLSDNVLLNAESKEDFGNLIPDPNPVSAIDFVNIIRNKKDVDLGFACDADGDRNFIFSKKHFLEPSDSLAILLSHINTVPFYKNKVYGVARSKATSKAVDLVAKDMNINSYIVPTGWKFFSNLLDSNKITLCGEESFGTGSIHIREKDGIWAILFWLHILSITKKSVDELIEELWDKYGRVYFTRLDYENLSKEQADTMLNNLKSTCNFENFTYEDPVDGTISDNQGIIIAIDDNTEIIVRVSGTGTFGVTIRAYIHKHELSKNKLHLDKSIYLESLRNQLTSFWGIQILPTTIV